MRILSETKLLINILLKNRFTKKDWRTLYRAGLGLPGLLLPDSAKKVFCLNAGSCGSSYIVALMRANGWARAYHEKKPDLDNEGILHYEQKFDTNYLKLLLRWSRHRVGFEANNRLFAMGRELLDIYPAAKFIHLYRDGRSVVTSAMNIAKAELTWGSRRLRYRCQELSGGDHLSNFDKCCNYWARYNKRILDDLRSVDSLSLKFEDLVAGKVDDLENFVGDKFQLTKLPPVNNKKPKRTGADAFPAYPDWPAENKRRFWELCGPVMDELGYQE